MSNFENFAWSADKQTLLLTRFAMNYKVDQIQYAR